MNDHYKQGKIEVIDFIRDQLTVEEFTGFCKGNMIKYASRANHKGGFEDAHKAKDYAKYWEDLGQQANLSESIREVSQLSQRAAHPLESVPERMLVENMDLKEDIKEKDVIIDEFKKELKESNEGTNNALSRLYKAEKELSDAKIYAAERERECRALKQTQIKLEKRIEDLSQQLADSHLTNK